MKKCKACGEEKPLDDFYAAPTNLDGRKGTCKPCYCARSHNWRKQNPSRVTTHNRRFREKRPEVTVEQNQRWAESNPEKILAGKKLRKAVETGKIVKPDTCEGCGEAKEPRRLDGHHADYGKPYEVEWLCRQCHVDRHSATA